jgi:Mg2+/citrate symporter
MPMFLQTHTYLIINFNIVSSLHHVFYACLCNKSEHKDATTKSEHTAENKCVNKSEHKSEHNNANMYQQTSLNNNVMYIFVDDVYMYIYVYVHYCFMVFQCVIQTLEVQPLTRSGHRRRLLPQF